jgi:hypothetical protein
MMKKLFVLIAVLGLALPVGVLLAAYAFPSTNDQNRINGRQYVEQISMDEGATTLNFVNPQNWVACFEYRTDGDTSQATGSPNYNPAIPDLYPFKCVRNSSTELTLNANEYIEVRSVFGAERDDDFDWTRFDVLPVPVPTEPGPDGEVSYRRQASEIMPYVVTNPALFGAPLSIYWQAPSGERVLLWSGVVSEFGDISYVLSPGRYAANEGYGMYQTTSDNPTAFSVWGRFVAVVNGTDVQDVVVAACSSTCEPTSYIVGADLVNQALRSPAEWRWAVPAAG